MKITIKLIPIIGAYIDLFLFTLILMNQYSYNNGSLICWCCLVLMTLFTLYYCLGIYIVLDATCYYRFYDPETEQIKMKDEGISLIKKGCKYISTSFIFLMIDLSVYHTYLTPKLRLISFTIIIILIHRILIKYINEIMVRNFI